MRDLPLEGLVVADFTRVLSGPTATMFLGDLGADVIKVERPGVGDDTRAWGPPFRGDDATYFLATNRSKRSIALDLRSPSGQQAAHELIRRADVVVENFRPGTMEALGLGHAELLRERPELVYCSISGFGAETGRTRPGYDFVVQAVGGLMSITGASEGGPMKVGVAVVDLLAGLHATIGILAAVRKAERTGAGGLVEVNLLSSLLSSLANQGSAYLGAGLVPGRLGNVHPSIAPYELLETGDRPIAVACGTDQQFRHLCQALDLHGLADDARFLRNGDRVAHREQLRDQLEARLRTRPAKDWLDTLDSAGVPAGPVNDLAEAFDIAGALGLQPVQEIDGSTQVASPIRLDGQTLAMTRRPPKLGEHDDEVRDWLGILDTTDPDAVGGCST
jgi:crotonobetainyl-CoA:carnitine CoA-transferase CaiB-like acyl-CoA transferase